MTARCLVAALALLTGGVAQAEIVVQILSMPSEVYSFEPVFILYSVENRGAVPVLLPSGAAPRHGSGIYWAHRGDEPRYMSRLVGYDATNYAAQTLWLAPGERWLFYVNIAFDLSALEGQFDVQGVVSSDGRCADEQTGGRESFSIEPLYLESVQLGERSARIYRCWEGEVRSDVRHLSVVRSQETVDQKAHAFLLQKRGLVHNREQTEWTMKRGRLAVDTFPTSHYAYAALTEDRTDVASLQRAVDLQPQNALNPWVRGAMAKRILDYRSSCWGGQKLAFGVSIGSLELAPGLREYLDQYAWFLEHRHCPAELAKQKNKGGSKR